MSLNLPCGRASILGSPALPCGGARTHLGVARLFKLAMGFKKYEWNSKETVCLGIAFST